jgi:amidophosphoribosyltransferase
VVNLRESGAREVHLRISCPPHRFPCHYGIDFPDPQELLANRMTPDQIKEFLGVDSLAYLSVDDMVASTGWPSGSFCTACFTGDYPLPVPPQGGKDAMERGRSRPGFFHEEVPGLFDGVSS